MYSTQFAQNAHFEAPALIHNRGTDLASQPNVQWAFNASGNLYPFPSAVTKHSKLSRCPFTVSALLPVLLCRIQHVQRGPQREHATLLAFGADV